MSGRSHGAGAGAGAGGGGPSVRFRPGSPDMSVKEERDTDVTIEDERTSAGSISSMRSTDTIRLPSTLLNPHSPTSLLGVHKEELDEDDDGELGINLTRPIG